MLHSFFPSPFAAITITVFLVILFSRERGGEGGHDPQGASKSSSSHFQPPTHHHGRCVCSVPRNPNPALLTSAHLVEFDVMYPRPCQTVRAAQFSGTRAATQDELGSLLFCPKAPFFFFFFFCLLLLFPSLHSALGQSLWGCGKRKKVLVECHPLCTGWWWW